MKMKPGILYLILILTGLCNISSGQGADIRLLKEININRNHQLDNTMKALSNSEAYIAGGVPLTVCLISLVNKDRCLLEKSINMSLAASISFVNTFVLKHAVNRDRPSVSYPYIQSFESEKHYSFPSGHTSSAFATATSLSLNCRKWYIVLPAYVWAGTIGYSRMHLGMHYPSDVLAGALVGASSAWATYKANQWLKKYFKEKYHFQANQ